MPFLSLHQFPVWLNILLFAVGAAAVWLAGTRLERSADAIAQRTGLGQAFTGMLLLAAATSLPEVATTVTALVFLNNPTLAINNLLGSVALQTVVLAAADWTKRDRGALTYFSPHFVLLIEGVGLVVLLQIAAAGAALEGISLGPIGLWPLLGFGAYAALMYQTHRLQGQPRWLPDHHCLDTEPQRRPLREPEIGIPGLEEQDPEPGEDPFPERSNRQVYGLFALAAAGVMIAGWAVAQTGDALAAQTGLGSSFVGATLLAVATSLPEVSTTVSASRHGNYSMAFSNIFGSNAFTIGLLFLADILYLEGPVMEHSPSSVLITAILATILTCVYLWGLLERENRSIGKLGWDSAIAVVLYLGGLVVLYFRG